MQKFAKGKEVDEEVLEGKTKEHRASTDCEELLSEDLSHQEELSELSNTSGLFYEDELFV